MMKPFFTACQRLLIAGIFLFALVGCGTYPRPLVTERQCLNDPEITIDVPVKGPQYLVDSVTEFLSEELGYFKKVVSDEEERDFDCVELRLVAQTNRYVTYEIDKIFFGEGVEIATDWVTFVKKDGHRLKEIITNDNMLRFFEDHRELVEEGVWEEVQWDLGQGMEVWIATPVGLLNDSLAHQFVYAPGIFEDLRYPLEAIRPYLSREARRVVR